MISIPTALVLGAGASKPYGLPLGKELLLEICEFLHPQRQSNEQNLLEAMHFERDRLHWFRTDLLRSAAPSVDAFLEIRHEFLEIGKAAIACALIRREVSELVIERGAERNWYEYLWHCIRTDDPNDLWKNTVSILTFNYDRSLEHFLFNAIEATYGLTSDKVRAVFARLPLVHLHGQLGQLYALAGQGRDYTAHRDPERVRTGAAGIKILHEAEDGDETFEKAREILCRSQIICFLGFGYHPTNIRRLGTAKMKLPIVCGTSLGMTGPEINEAYKNIGHACHVQGGHVLEFLRSSGVLIGGVQPPR